MPKKRKTRATRVRTLANKIARDLFTDFSGFYADRLVMVDKDGKPAGGWCERAVADRISRYLSEFLKET